MNSDDCLGSLADSLAYISRTSALEWLTDVQEWSFKATGIESQSSWIECPVLPIADIRSRQDQAEIEVS